MIDPTWKLEGTRSLVFHGERAKITIQDMYAHVHWTKINAEKSRIHALVRAALDPELPPADGRVIINVIQYCKAHPMDASNIPLKMYEDGLKGWYIIDDSPDYVVQVSAASVYDPSLEEDRLELHITRIGPAFTDVCPECGHYYPNKKALAAHRKREGCGSTYDEV